MPAPQALMPASGARLQRLRIGALPSVAPSLLPAALAALRERLPQVQVQVQTGANAPLLDALRAGELDLVAGRMSDPQLMAGLTFELLYTEPLALVARAGPSAGGRLRRRCRRCCAIRSWSTAKARSRAITPRAFSRASACACPRM